MKDPLEPHIFQLVQEVADELAMEVYVVGGYVRDHLLKRPSTDVDFVCLGDAATLAEAVASKLSGSPKVSIFRTFGTAHIHHCEWDYEFVGARRESYRSNSRKPEVEPGTLADDQLRRDFTINAMAIRLSKSGTADLVDPFNGVQDLHEGIIRTPADPDLTFSDDPLRMLRAIRFACQLGFRIVNNTYQGIRKQSERIAIVSMERIKDELNKIVSSPTPGDGFRMLFHTGLLQHFFPELVELHGVDERNGIRHKDNFFHTLKVLDNVAEYSDDLWLRWAALLHDIAKPRTKDFNDKDGWTFHGHEFVGSKMVKRIFTRLKLPLNEHMKFVEKMVLLHLRPIALTKEVVTDSAIRRLIFDAGDDIDALLLLSKCDITSKNERKVEQYLRNLELVRQKIADVEERDRIRNFQPPLSGDEIMDLFDLKPGREIGLIKNALKDAILEGIIPNNKVEALKFAREKGSELGLRAVNYS